MSGGFHSIEEEWNKKVNESGKTFILEEATYRVKDGQPEVILYSRDYNNRMESTEHVIKGFRPYFWAPANETHVNIPSGCEFSEEVMQDALSREIRKVYTDVPGTVPKIRDRFTFTDMADVLFEKRFLIDTGIKYAYQWVRDVDGHKAIPVDVPSIILPRIAYFDIEVRSPEGVLPLPDYAKYPIVTIQVMDSYTGKIVIFTNGMPQTEHADHIACSDEHEMFRAFMDYLIYTDSDVLTGWNCLPGNTRVFTEFGFQPISEIKPGINLHDGSTILQHAQTGEKEIFNIETRLMWGIQTSGDHRFLIRSLPSDKKYHWKHISNYPQYWKPANELTSNDMICCPFGEGNKNQDNGFDLHKMYLMGFIYGDGTISDQYMFQLYNKDKTLIEKLKHPDKQIWFSNGVWCTKLARKYYTDVEHFIIGGDGKKELNIQALSLLSPREFCAFIAGWYDADGSFWDSDIFAIFDDSRGHQDVCKLFLHFGMLSSFGARNTYNILCAIPTVWDYIREMSHYPDTVKYRDVRHRSPELKKHFRYGFTSDFSEVCIGIEQVEDTGICEQCYDIETSLHKFNIGCIVHNSASYDIPYIIRRAKAIGATLKGLGRFNNVKSELDEKHVYTNKVTGRSIIDMLPAFKKMMMGSGQLESYALKNIISDSDLLDKFDKDGNITKKYSFTYEDLGPHIDKYFNECRWDEMLEYCRNDVRALRNIDESKGLFRFYETLRSIGGCRLDDTLFNSKVIEMLLCHGGIAPMPTKDHARVKEDFEGAFVFTPVPGIHEWVGTVDVAALYPNIMVGFNMQVDKDGVTIAVLKNMMALRETYRAQRLAGDPEAEDKEQVVKAIANSFYGVVGSTAFRLYNKDNALFVTSTGQKINKFIRDCCEEVGKKSIVYADSVTGDAKVKVYNGDGNFNLMNIENLFTKVDFTDGEKEYCNLENCYVESIDDHGKIVLDRIKFIMRHKCNKKIYKVSITNSWSINVTEDHSLFVYANASKKPGVPQHERAIMCPTKELGIHHKNVITKRCSIHKFVNSINKPIKFYEYLGYHVGNGTLHYDICHNNNTYYGGVSFGEDADTLEPYFIPFLQDEKYITNLFRDKRGGSHRGDIKYSGIEFIRFIEEHIGHSKDKRVPEFMFYETRENICAFLRGYFTADGTVLIRDEHPIVRVTSISKSLLEGMNQLLYLVGVASGINTENQPNTYNGISSGTYSSHLIVYDIPRFKECVGFITERKHSRMKQCTPFKVDDSIDWSYSSRATKQLLPDFDGYVYDLHCEKTHKFFANDILLHNTDSAFVKPIQSPEEAIELQDYLNKRLAVWSKENGSSVDFSLKAEKLFKRLLFKKASSGKGAAKKKYAGHLVWKDGKVKDELAFMGLELKRSDQANVSKVVLKDFLTTLLIDGSEEKAIKIVKKAYDDLRGGKVSIYDMSIPKAARSIKTDSPWKRGIHYAKTEYSYILADGAKPRLLHLTNGHEICIDDEFDVSRIEKLIDYNEMANKVIKKKMESYLWSIGYRWDKVVLGQKDVTDWF